MEHLIFSPHFTAEQSLVCFESLGPILSLVKFEQNSHEIHLVKTFASFLVLALDRFQIQYDYLLVPDKTNQLLTHIFSKMLSIPISPYRPDKKGLLCSVKGKKIPFENSDILSIALIK